MPTPTDIAVAYGAICLTVIVVGLLVLLAVTVHDWLGLRRGHARDRRYSTHAASETALIARLEQIPTPGPWEMS